MWSDVKRTFSYIISSVRFHGNTLKLWFDNEADNLINRGDDLIRNAGYSDNIVDELMVITNRLFELDQRRPAEKPAEVSRFGVELR